MYNETEHDVTHFRHIDIFPRKQRKDVIDQILQTAYLNLVTTLLNAKVYCALRHAPLNMTATPDLTLLQYI